jgi:hypothetical protein
MPKLVNSQKVSLNLCGKSLDFFFARRATESDVGPFRLRRDESFVHRSDSFLKLSAHRCEIPASLSVVPRKSTRQTQSGGAVQKNSQVEQATQPRPPQQPQTVN